MYSMLTQEVSVVEGPVVIVIVPPAVIVAAGEVIGAYRSAILAISACIWYKPQRESATLKRKIRGAVLRITKVECI
jgi:hypothetical protein